MSEEYIFYLCLFVGGLGLLVGIGLKYFGYLILKKLDYWPYRLEELLYFWREKGRPYNDAQVSSMIQNVNQELLSKRNEFWALYGQVMLSVFVITILGILLLAKVISAEAGLPILSGVVGFSIAKGVDTGKTLLKMPENRNPEG